MGLSDGRNALEERRVCCCYRESNRCSVVLSAHGTVTVLTELPRLPVIIMVFLSYIDLSGLFKLRLLNRRAG